MSKLNKYVFCNYSESEQQIVLYNTYTQEMCMIESSDGNIDEALQKRKRSIARTYFLK